MLRMSQEACELVGCLLEHYVIDVLKKILCYWLTEVLVAIEWFVCGTFIKPLDFDVVVSSIVSLSNRT